MTMIIYIVFGTLKRLNEMVEHPFFPVGLQKNIDIFQYEM